MVEHMSAQTTHYQNQQSFNGVQTQHWHYRRNEFEIPGLINNTTSANNHRFSLFKWFKRRDSTSSAENTRGRIFRRSKRRQSTSSTSSSEDTFYSTATVRSFAFQSGIRRDVEHSSLPLRHSNGAVGPFAPGAAKLIEKRKFRDDKLQHVDTTATYTLPSAFTQRKDIESRYSLHPANAPFLSYDSIPIVDRRPRTFAEVRRNVKDNNVATGSLASNSSLSAVKKVHVKGKRRAPEPPVQSTASVYVAGENCNSKRASGSRRKRRPAPKPPGPTENNLSSNHNTLSSETSTGMDTLLASKSCQTISNDTLVLRKGVLLSKRRDVDCLSESKSTLPTLSARDSHVEATTIHNPTTASGESNTPSGTMMPRPWYKRNVFNDYSNGGSKESSINTKRGGSDILRGLSSPQPTDIKDDGASSTSASSQLSTSFPFEGSLSKLGFFNRGDRHHHDDKKKENKRKSSVSILTNISELDKEAAAIVQEEQARSRASMILQAAKLDEDFERVTGANDAIIHEIVNSSLENSPRRSTRALISKFNAIGNITKVTVNSSFFTKSSGNASPKAKTKRFSQECNNGRRDNSRVDDKIERDLSKYFLPHQSPSKRQSTSIFTEIIDAGKSKALVADAKASTTSKTPPLTASTTATMTARPRVERPTIEKNNNMEYVKSLTAELDDVATGIARLKRELDTRPKIIGNTKNYRGRVAQANKGQKTIVNKQNPTKDKDIANFEKEFTKIFDEIDKQFQTRDAKIAATKSDGSTNFNKTSISNQVANVLDILVSADKGDAIDRGKNVVLPREDRKSVKSSIDERNNEMKGKVVTTGAVRISGVDDESTQQLKEMLREMKHSLPKYLKAKNSRANDGKTKEFTMLSDAANKKSFTKSSRIVKETLASPTMSRKVSSSIQTCGNVRKIMNEITSMANERSRRNDAFVEPSATSKLPRNSYYKLIEANEFDEIEEKKDKAHQENTYANVMERYMYENTQITSTSSVDKAIGKGRRDSNSRVKIDLRETDNKATAAPVLPHANKHNVCERSENNDEEAKLDEIKKQCMNTLAVNRLLRKLEAAIASGRHQQAAGLAKELAQLKIHCSVIRQRSCKAKETLNLNMFIEDKEAHQGPIPLQLPVNMTVAQLKAKIHIEFEIPANVQRWIIGKNLADNDELTLHELQAVEGSPIFLYLVAPPDLQNKEIIKVNNLKEKEEKKVKIQLDEETNEVHNEQIDKMNVEMEMGLETVVEPKADVAVKTTESESREEKDESLTNEEKLQRYEELMSLENCDIISNIELIECPVCFMIFGPGEGVTLRDCLHTFCRLCVANTVRYCEEAEVKCPYRDVDYTCESTLQEREIKALVAPEVYQQHLAKSIAQAENNAGNNAFHCKTPDCAGWCIYDDNVNNFLCPVCKINNCLTCQAVHMGKNCRQYQEELKYSKETDHESKRTAAMLEEMVKRGEALSCPTCAVVLMKKWGCDWLRCSMCKTEICWVTRGPRWGPGGKGDTSGGCHCGENGIKCHPRCNYCH